MKLEELTKLEKLIDYNALSEVTGIPLGTLYAKVHANEIPHVRLGPRTVRFLVADIAAWIEGGYRPAKQSSGE